MNRFRLIFDLTVSVLLIFVLTCICHGGTSAANPYPELIGTWVSTGKVSPSVKFTIGGNQLKYMNPGESNPQYFNNGEVVCPALDGGKYTINIFDDTHYVMMGRDIVDDVEYPMVNISVSDKSGKMVLVRAELKNKQLVGKVSVGKYPKMTYQTAPGTNDVFVKQK